jgi:hypothetical protein
MADNGRIKKEMVLLYTHTGLVMGIQKMIRPKRKAAEMAESKIKCVLEWEGCSENSEMWKQVETKFNEEYEGHNLSENEGEEIGDFDCENSSDDSGDSIASDDSLHDFIVNSSQGESEREASDFEEESFIESDYSSSEEEVDMDDLVSDDEVKNNSYVRHNTEIFDGVE